MTHRGPIVDCRTKAMYADHACRQFVEYIEPMSLPVSYECEPLDMWLTRVYSGRTPATRLKRFMTQLDSVVFSSMELKR